MKENARLITFMTAAFVATACSDIGARPAAGPSATVGAGAAAEARADEECFSRADVERMLREHVPDKVRTAQARVASVDQVRSRDDVDRYVDRLMAEFDADGDGIIATSELPDPSPIVNGRLFMSGAPLEGVMGGDGSDEAPAEDVRFSREDVKEVVLHFFDDADADEDGALNTETEVESFQRFMALQEIEILQMYDMIR